MISFLIYHNKRVSQEGFELSTDGFTVHCSARLSYCECNYIVYNILITMYIVIYNFMPHAPLPPQFAQPRTSTCH